MADIRAFQNEWTAPRSLVETHSALLAVLRSLNGNVKQSTDTYIECDFGSALLSRIIGELFASKNTLAKKAEVTLEPIGTNATRIRLVVRDRLKLIAFKIGIVDKYEQALRELAESIYASSQRAQIA